jgi:HEPN domain-containing protein
MNEHTIDNWLRLSDYDLETARAMQKTGRYLYVAFTCHQAIEKILKAVHIKSTQTTPPYTHSLMKLLKDTGLINELNSNQTAFIEEMSVYYIESRYSEEIEIIQSELTPEKSKEILLKTEEFHKWLTGRL